MSKESSLMKIKLFTSTKTFLIIPNLKNQNLISCWVKIEKLPVNQTSPYLHQLWNYSRKYYLAQTEIHSIKNLLFGRHRFYLASIQFIKFPSLQSSDTKLNILFYSLNSYFLFQLTESSSLFIFLT